MSANTRALAYPLALVASTLLLGAQEPLAIVDVHVLPMDSERVLEHHTVIVRDGRIAAVGRSSEVDVPEGHRVIDGGGRYLLPGLADMHVHIWNESELLLDLAAGVTSVRNMWGAPIHLEWQAKARAGTFFGPTVYTTGPILDGKPPTWEGSVGIDDPDEAFAEVEREKEAGYPEIKVYSGLSEDVYIALVDAAHELGMRVTGHVPTSVGLYTALEAGQDCIEHLEGYFGGWIRRPDPAELIDRTLEAGTWNCPTLVVMKRIASLGDPSTLKARPEMRYVDPETRAAWDPSADFRFRNMTASDFAATEQRVRAMQEFVGALHARGGRILCGTDTPNPYVIPGFAVHDELALLVESGLSPYEALRAATADAAEYLEQRTEFGRVEPGLRADLLLLEENPFEDIARTRERAGVVVRGEWFPQSELQRRLEELAASLEQEIPESALELPDGGEHLFGGRYEVRLNDVRSGAERLATRRMEDGRLAVLSRSATADGSSEEIRLEVGEDFAPEGFVYVRRSSGTTLRITGQRTGNRMHFDVEPEEGGLPAELPMEEGALLSLRSLASLQVLALRFRDLAPGSKARFEEAELRVVPGLKLESYTSTVVSTAADGDAPRSFEIQAPGARRIEYTIDGEGRLLEARFHRQIGRVAFVLSDAE